MKKRARAVSYFFSLIAVAAIFFSIEFITEKYFYPDDETVDILAAVIGALLFARFRRFFDRVTDRIFFHGPRDTRAEFITNISHELQTPIAILRGNVEVLQSGCATDAERVLAERVIVTTLDGMSRLIGSVLRSAKATFDVKAASREYLAVGALLREVHEDCHILAEDKGIRFVIAPDAADDGGEGSEFLFVRAERDRLKEVMLNLISNAFKHTACGGVVTLRAERARAAARAGAVARIIVEDTGAGIPPEALPHIFERFYKIKNGYIAFADGGDAGAPPVPSTGVGLNICRQIVEAHGGTITAESAPGKGSRFAIHLPLAPP